jgi:hypothetical protein
MSAVKVTLTPLLRFARGLSDRFPPTAADFRAIKDGPRQRTFGRHCCGPDPQPAAASAFM